MELDAVVGGRMNSDRAGLRTCSRQTLPVESAKVV